MLKIYFTWFMASFCCCVYGQTITVIEQGTNEPIELATVASNSPRLLVTTDPNGQADISAFTDVKHIEIRFIGYKTIRTSFVNLQKNKFNVEMTEAYLAMDEVVISATRWQQSSNNVPSKIISISKEEIELQNPQTAADLLAVSGNVYIQKSQQGGGSPMIRGFATNRLLYTIDGVRMNTAIFRGGNLQNVINIDPFSIENTEVLFGPGSVIYGSDAIGGVMSFKTLTPKLSTTEEPNIKGNALIRNSSANHEKTGHFDVNIGWKKWSMVTSVSSWDYDHLRQGSNGPEDYIKPIYVQRQDSIDVLITQDDPLLQIPTAYSQINLLQKFRFVPNENWDIQYGFHYSETSPYGRYDRHNRMRNGTARYAEWNYGSQKWMMNNLSIVHQGNNGIYDQVSLRLAYQNFEESRIDRSLNNDERNTQIEKVDAISINTDFIKSVGSKNVLNYGFEYISNEVSSTGEVTDISTTVKTNGPSRYPQSTWQSMAVYLNNQYNVSDLLTLQAGLRYNQFILKAEFDSTFFPFPFDNAKLDQGSLTGSLGAVIRPSEEWVINANFGTAFRSPNVDDIGKVFDSEPGSVTVPNPDLKAEYAYNFDLGLAKIFADVVKIDVTGYYTLLENALVRRNFTLNGLDMIMYDGELSQVQAIQNAASAHVYGIQAGIEINLSEGFELSSDLNYQKGREELDDGTKSESRHAAPMFGTTRLKYNFNKLNLELYTNYQSERKFEDLALEEQGKDEIYAKDENGNNYAPAWYTLNFKIMLPITDKFSISGGIENITDQRYRPYSSGVSGAGRNYILALRAYLN